MHILQAWPTFPDLQVQFSESHWRLCALRVDGSFSIGALVGVSPPAAAGTVVLSLSALLVIDSDQQQLGSERITNIRQHRRPERIFSLLVLERVTGWDYRLRGFRSVPERRSGH